MFKNMKHDDQSDAHQATPALPLTDFFSRLKRGPPLAIPDFPLFILWTHKSAYTTTLKWFLFQNGLLDEANVRTPDWPHHYWNERLANFPGYHDFCYEAFFKREKASLKIIRDPAKRVVSAFIHFIRERVGFKDAWESFIVWKTSQQLGEEPNASFEQFLHFIIAEMDSGKLKDPHLLPQFCSVQDPFVGSYVTVENYHSNIRLVEQRFGLLTSPIDKFSISGHHRPAKANPSYPPDCSRLVLVRESCLSEGFPDEMALLNETTTPLVKKAYHQDYEAYAKYYS